MRRIFVTATLIAATACAPKNPPSSTPTPVKPTAPPPPAAPPPAPTTGVHLGPSVVHYLVHQSLHAEQQLPGQNQTQVIDRGTRLYVVATITGPADSAGYRVTFTVDSIALDSGTTLPPNLDLSAARGLVYEGRLTPTGITNLTALADSSRAAPFVQLLGLLGTFYPRLPKSGIAPGAEWTDSTTTDDRVVIDVKRHSVNRTRAAAWEDRGGTRALRLDVTSPYTVAGKGTQQNQPVEVAGSGLETTTHFITSDGRYFGGESTDSSSITVTFPYQSVTIPATRVLRLTINPQR